MLITRFALLHGHVPTYMYCAVEMVNVLAGMHVL